MEYWILFGVFTALMLVGTPIAFCLGIASFATVLYLGRPAMVVFQQLNSGLAGFTLLAIPFFIFAGDLMMRGGIAARIIAFAGAVIGHVRGGLGQVNVAASTLFGGISGSAVAEAAAVGGIMIPQMKERGYGADYAVNVTSMAALIALLLPPSHNMIIYSLSGGGRISIADLFTAGIIPGLLLAVALMITAYLVAVKRGYPTEPFPGFRKAFQYFLISIPGLMLIVIIFGGVRSGMFTATESSCIAVIYALLVTLFVYRSLSWGEFVHAVLGAVRTTSMVLFIIGAAASFGWLMAYLRVAPILTDLISNITQDPLMVLLLINIVLLLLGTFMDMGPLIIITTPIFLPMVTAFGVNPVHFGVIMILNLGIGLNTPPLGPVQFVAAAVGKITVWEAMKSIWPFYLAGLIVLGLVTYIPALSLWLPSLFR
ncbi:MULTISPECIES: TRAP transporter large permease [unclassified Devosia]|uniref:TRAP transporter large permease n=1 Tax=unclassified Devosia TaxID=196773 RepID=UPI0015FBC0DF|nr:MULTISPECIES: TRAP transporter large permease [unclassified Devosia]MBJ6987598.1 TRAP transporter large permease [Devosia sp. MC521]MBK1794064.1 TRAP transporter large permease [Devosia sp. WQ 349K1]QMW61950.1 TRAP transporter large permease [Devosia sp. MC521]